MKTEKNRIAIELETLNKLLNKAPNGKLIVAKNGSYTKWYYANEKFRSYLPKSKRDLAIKLAEKKYISAKIDQLSSEQAAIEQYLNTHSEHSKRLNTITANKDIAQLLKPFFNIHNINLSQWAEDEFSQNPQNPEHLIHTSNSGHKVRSKSEAMIDSLLYLNNIPFRYECILTLGPKVFYPDFTIRHPETGQFYYWEHFGMMDNPDYAQKTFNKLNFYSSYDIIPTINLIATYETSNHPLTIDKIEQIIREYFC